MLSMEDTKVKYEKAIGEMDFPDCFFYFKEGRKCGRDKTYQKRRCFIKRN